MFPFLKNAWTHFLFPSLCLHCEKLLSEDVLLLCHSCLEDLHVFEYEEVCMKCLSHLENDLCPSCALFPSPFEHITAAYFTTPVANTLIKTSRKWEASYLVQGIAALMGLSLLKKELSFPDFLIPCPANSSLFIKDNLTQELSRLLNIPILERGILRSFTKPHRMTREAGETLENRSIVLVSDSCSPALLETGRALSTLFPRRLDAVVFSAPLKMYSV